MKPFRPSSDVRHVANRGFALLIVLAVLVLTLMLSLAFFSRNMTNAMISSSSSASQQAGVLTDSTVNLIVSDLLQEIGAGSETNAVSLPPGGRKLFSPRAVNTGDSWLGSSRAISTAPSMLPDRVVANAANAPASLLKQSLHGLPFFTERPGVTNNPALPPIPNRASLANSTSSGGQNSGVSTLQWQSPALVATSEEITDPDWIYINRQGETLNTFATS